MGKMYDDSGRPLDADDFKYEVDQGRMTSNEDGTVFTTPDGIPYDDKGNCLLDDAT